MNTPFCLKCSLPLPVCTGAPGGFDSTHDYKPVITNEIKLKESFPSITSAMESVMNGNFPAIFLVSRQWAGYRAEHSDFYGTFEKHGQVRILEGDNILFDAQQFTFAPYTNGRRSFLGYAKEKSWTHQGEKSDTYLASRISLHFKKNDSVDSSRGVIVSCMSDPRRIENYAICIQLDEPVVRIPDGMFSLGDYGNRLKRLNDALAETIRYNLIQVTFSSPLQMQLTNMLDEMVGRYTFIEDSPEEGVLGVDLYNMGNPTSVIRRYFEGKKLYVEDFKEDVKVGFKCKLNNGIDIPRVRQEWHLTVEYGARGRFDIVAMHLRNATATN